MNRNLTYLGLMSTVRRKPNKELIPKNLLPTAKHESGGKMIWGCSTPSGMENLVSIENNMDQYKCINIQTENLKISAPKKMIFL